MICLFLFSTFRIFGYVLLSSMLDCLSLRSVSSTSLFLQIVITIALQYDGWHNQALYSLLTLCPLTVQLYYKHCIHWIHIESILILFYFSLHFLVISINLSDKIKIQNSDRANTKVYKYLRLGHVPWRSEYCLLTSHIQRVLYVLIGKTENSVRWLRINYQQVCKMRVRIRPKGRL